eukprot:256408-Prorocentrum_minimum.AAC.1
MRSNLPCAAPNGAPCAPRSGCMLSTLARLAPLRVFALHPRAIGSRSGYMLSNLARLAPAPGICSPPSRDWLPLRVYALHPRAIGLRYLTRVSSAAFASLSALKAKRQRTVYRLTLVKGWNTEVRYDRRTLVRGVISQSRGVTSQSRGVTSQSTPRYVRPRTRRTRECRDDCLPLLPPPSRPRNRGWE